MRKRLIKKLDYKERNWLYKAIFRMIVADKAVAKEEVDELMETLRMVAGKDIKDFSVITSSPEFLEPLKPLKRIPFEHSFIILSEIIRVAAIDYNLAIEEQELLQEIISLLDFKQDALGDVMDWARNLAQINREELELKEVLKQKYLSG